MIPINALEKSIRSLAEKATIGMGNLLKKSLATPIDSNGIIGHLDLKVTRNGDTSITIETQFPDYAYFVEHGRGPGKMPPERPIKDWVKKHNISEDAVFPIRRKIGREGTKAHPFTEPLRRMIEMITKTCLSFNAKYIKEDISKDLSNLTGLDAKI